MPEPRDIEEEAARRQYTKPHSGNHPIPTVQGYREHRKEIQDQYEEEQEAQQGPEDESKPKRAFDTAKAILKGQEVPQSRHDPYPSSNHNYASQPSRSRDSGVALWPAQGDGRQEYDNNNDKNEQQPSGKTATEVVAGSRDPREKRKAMEKTKRHGAGRKVTDPVTHLPITIHDATEKDLNSVQENEAEPGTLHSTATGPQGASKTEQELDEEQGKLQRSFNGAQKLFPPPDFDDMRKELASVYQRATFSGLTIAGLAAAAFLLMPSLSGQFSSNIFTAFRVAGMSLVALGTAFGFSRYASKKTEELFNDEVWGAAKRRETAELESNAELPESAQWLNGFLSSVWPLISPELFNGLVDTIEDVMQASLPKAIKMVSVDDLGQGNEAPRLLGVRWLPTGAAAQSVGSDGELKKPGHSTESDRTDPENAQQQATDSDGQTSAPDASSKQEQQSQIAMREGMEAEEGDFINLELALAYRSRKSGKSIKEKAKNAHLYIKFYGPGGVSVPVWVELSGFIAIVRLRLQLTPDPPFVSLCTLTMLGQPRVTLSCSPLTKHFNLMDVPLLSSFVQSSIDAAVAEYVAPKSLTLNLKDMLVGEDFKKDTISRGVVWICIDKARDFKHGDGSIGPLSEDSSDAYVTVSWGKFGKPVSSTRIITDSNEPIWHENTSILVSPEELNAEEKLRLQLWDSDKWTADDDLGRVEVDLKDLMKSSESCNNIQKREDRFVGQDPDEQMPGCLNWSVGYFRKTTITPRQFEQQTVNDQIRNKDQLEKHVIDMAEKKLREASKSARSDELRQLIIQDYRDMEDSMIISAPPCPDKVSGILSIQIHNITGLEVKKLSKPRKNASGDEEDEAENTDDLPDSYVTIILNHSKIYRTRTKPKNSKPFFNASCERFVRDWRDSELIVSVRGSREREDDPLIGIVYFPLAKVLAHRSQIMDNFPITGGIGYGRARISLVWRSVELTLPPHLRGWDYGTLEIGDTVKAVNLPEEVTRQRLKMYTNLGRAKFTAHEGRGWKVSRTRDDNAFMAVRKRYASPLVVEFRKSVIGPDHTIAFAVLWLQDLVDEEDETKVLKVWKGSKDGLRRAKSSCDYQGIKEGEQPLGEIEISTRFWRGLSGYHKSYAAKTQNGDLRNVMECLDTVTDESLDKDNDEHVSVDDSQSESENEHSEKNKDTDSATRKKLKVHTNDDSSKGSSSSSSSLSDSNDSGSKRSLSNLNKKFKKIMKNPVEGSVDTAASALAPGHVDDNDNSRGVRNQLRDYKDHHTQLHRQHRGIMQWRAAREADHVGGKFARLKGRMEHLFEHGEKESGVETEV